MSDRVRPLKMENLIGGSQNDMFPTALNPNQDLLDAHGIAVQNQESADEEVQITRDGGDNLVMFDPVSGQFLLSDIRYSAPNAGHLEILRTSGRVTGAILWTDGTKTKKVKETEITRTDGLVSGVVEKEFKADGTLNFELTYTVTRNNGVVSSIAVSRS